MKQIYLYGGCATRDTFEEIEIKENFNILRYFARTIPASFSAEPFDLKKNPIKFANPDSFETRIVIDDLSRNFLKVSDDEFDLIIMDFGTASYENLFDIDGEIGTLSSYASEFLKNSNIEFNTIENWSHEYLKLHNRGIDKFLELFSRKKVVINRIYHGISHSKQDEDIKSEVNRKLNHIYDYISNSGKILDLTFICYPEYLLTLDPEHKWGPGIFHYKKEFYEFQKDELLKIIKN